MAGELSKRIAVAAIGIPVAAVAIYLGGWYFAGFLAVIAALGAREFYRLVRQTGIEPFDLPGAAASGVLVLNALPGGPLQSAQRSWNLAVLLVISFFGLAIGLRTADRRPLAAAGVTVAGALLVGGTLAYAIWLREFPTVTRRVGLSTSDVSPAWQGTALVAFPLLITWLNDTFAFVVGRTLGRHKLLPSVSPGKTMEGALAGLGAGIVVAVLLGSMVLGPQMGVAASPLVWALGGALVAAVAQLGDLAESLLKREARVKDSGSLLPGHGGVLDRFDALFFAIPVSYWFLRWLGLH